MTSKEKAKERYRRCLEYIECAGRLLKCAASELSPLVNVSDQWDLTRETHDLVHQLWRELAYARAREECDLSSDHQNLIEG